MTLKNRYPRVLTALALVALLMVLAILPGFAASVPALTVENRSGAVGETLTVPIVLSEAPDGISGFDLRVTLDDSSVASFTDAQFPDFGIAQYDLTSSSEIKLRVADLKGVVQSGASNSTLATLTVQALKVGTAQLAVNVSIMDDDDGFPVEAQTVNGTVAIGSLPVSSFTFACDELNCGFTDSSKDSDGSIQAWHWSFGDGNSSGEQNPSHAYASDGTYTVELTVTDDGGAMNTSAQSVTVALSKPPAAHVHDLDNRSEKLKKGAWKSIVTVAVYDNNKNPVSGATVTGTFSQNWKPVASVSCLTAANGMCSVDSGQMPKKKGSAMFTVDDVVHGILAYDPSSNHDPDGDSDGTTITLSK